jgi:hypothetical protein
MSGIATMQRGKTHYREVSLLRQQRVSSVKRGTPDKSKDRSRVQFCEESHFFLSDGRNPSSIPVVNGKAIQMSDEMPVGAAEREYPLLPRAEDLMAAVVREQAEKLLAALIFEDLDGPSSQVKSIRWCSVRTVWRTSALYELELASPSVGREADALGTVFVRYRNAETGQIEETSKSLGVSIIRRMTVEENPRFFLAAGVSSSTAKLAVGTDSALQLVVQESSGLTQVDVAAFPRIQPLDVAARPIPRGKAFFEAMFAPGRPAAFTWRPLERQAEREEVRFYARDIALANVT